MISKELKFMTLIYDPEGRILYLQGDNRWVMGNIAISWRCFYSVFCFIARIFRMKRR